MSPRDGDTPYYAGVILARNFAVVSGQLTRVNKRVKCTENSLLLFVHSVCKYINLLLMKISTEASKTNTSDLMEIWFLRFSTISFKIANLNKFETCEILHFSACKVMEFRTWKSFELSKCSLVESFQNSRIFNFV